MDLKEKPRKVLHIVHSFLRGGIESCLHYLTNEQKNDPSLDITILCCEDFDKILNDRIVKNGIKCVFIRITPSTLSLKKYRSAYRLCQGFDVLHFHIFLPILSFYLSSIKVPKLYTVHNSGVALRPRHFKARLKEMLFIKFLNSHVDAIANNSHYTKGYWEQLGITNRNNFVVPNGVGPVAHSQGLEQSEKPGELHGKIVIGTTSRLIPWKRVDILLDAFHNLENRANLMLLIVGDGPDLGKLKSQAVSLGLESSVIFAGHQKNIGDYQSWMDICVFASISEPFGLVAIECLRKGKPVFVMQDGGGLPEIIRPIDPNNIATSVTHLSSLLDEAIKSLPVSESSVSDRYEYSKSFSSSKMALEYKEVYKILESNRT